MGPSCPPKWASSLTSCTPTAAPRSRSSRTAGSLLRCWQFRAGRAIRLQIAQGVLDAGQEMLEQRRVPEDRRARPQRTVEHAALPIRANPRHGKIFVRPAHWQDTAVWRKAGLLHIDAEKYMEMVAQGRLLELKGLVGNLKFLAVKYGIQRALLVLHLHRHGLPIPGMSAVLGRPQHLAERRPLVVLGILHEGRNGIVNSHEPLAPRDVGQQQILQLRVFK